MKVPTYPEDSYEQFDYENHSLVASRDREGCWTRYFHDVMCLSGLLMKAVTVFCQTYAESGRLKTFIPR